MQQYLNLGRNILTNGIRKPNRTGIDTIGIHGAMMQFDLAKGFPIVTAKKTFWKMSVAEMLGFLRGYTNAKDFEKLGTKVWNANADENEAWLANVHRKGAGDLGPIYGAMARRWPKAICSVDKSREILGFDISTGKRCEGDPSYRVDDNTGVVYEEIDQLRKVVDDLSQGIDDRREIVSHWNPAVFDRIALPSCHLIYQFGIHGDRLNLSMYQRSCDYGLGVPFNIVGYAWLLSVIAQITGLKPGNFTHFLHDVHIYVNHLDGINEMLRRVTHALPIFEINPDIKTLEDLETWVTLDDFEMVNYVCNSKISLEMAV